MTEKWFNVGKIVNTHGIKGEVRVISSTDFAEERYQRGNKLFLFKNDQDQPIEVTVEFHRIHKNFDLLTFEGLADIQKVECFKGFLIKVPEEQLGELDEGEFYYHEIIGCQVFSEEGVEIGKIHEVLSTGANDVWIVKRKSGKDVLIPYIDDIVREVDIEAQKVVISLMEGLIDE